MADTLQRSSEKLREKKKNKFMEEKKLYSQFKTHDGESEIATV
jgi:hypothetical protein